MGQQPNVELRIEDLPRHTPHPAPAGRWTPSRPGDLAGPGEVPRGGAFGTPGPGSGYALRILRGRPLPGEAAHRHDVESAVAAVMAARAAALGRAPVPADVDAAIALIGPAVSQLAGIAHDHGRLRALVAAIPVDRLTLAPTRLAG